jgi:tRNA nucleotidyltransferase (CCA-adding enzyme)
VRFAALCHELDPDGALDALCRRLPVPTAWGEPARLVARWFATLAAADTAEAESLWSLLQGCDALRRAERFEQVLAAAESGLHARGQAPDAAIGRLRAAWQAALSVRGRDLAREGFEGAALGRELERRRLAAITDVSGGSRDPGAGPE